MPYNDSLLYGLLQDRRAKREAAVQSEREGLVQSMNLSRERIAQQERELDMEAKRAELAHKYATLAGVPVQSQYQLQNAPVGQSAEIGTNIGRYELARMEQDKAALEQRLTRAGSNVEVARINAAARKNSDAVGLAKEYIKSKDRRLLGMMQMTMQEAERQLAYMKAQETLIGTLDPAAVEAFNREMEIHQSTVDTLRTALSTPGAMPPVPGRSSVAVPATPAATPTPAPAAPPAAADKYLTK